jgi:c-di-GMP-binding flagellar brake protein YcgR
MQKTGWLEKRQHERVTATLKASYERLGDAHASELRNNPDYLATPNAGGFWNDQSSLNGTTRDVSKGGLALVGQDPFRIGEQLLVRLELPQVKGPVTCLAEVRWVDEFEEMHRKVYRAGLKFTSLLKDDVLRLDAYLKGGR